MFEMMGAVVMIPTIKIVMHTALLLIFTLVRNSSTSLKILRIDLRTKWRSDLLPTAQLHLRQG